MFSPPKWVGLREAKKDDLWPACRMRSITGLGIGLVLRDHVGDFILDTFKTVENDGLESRSPWPPPSKKQPPGFRFTSS